ncbi:MULTISPECIES: hypothetical protein [unclassified Janthinobacterium]|uniref:hypothetical protein n=1 Tax=unclassified Janthinobacterium TaxID=2610881 RepID=UPI0016099EE6|nr:MULTISPECIES: hypothetical protein [unclassified Janthinobacterium]MBB5609360.1 hypothetical protein [Janthinobacterium sp. S3T4]MBB5614533.1 hypothetical protein [Janthinobacterium sp. S3M3]
MADVTHAELDAKLATSSARVERRFELIETSVDMRVEAIDTKLTAGLSSMELLLARKFAEFDATLQKSTADTVKWVAGIVMGLGVIGISLMTFLLNNVPPKTPPPPPAPVVIYAQPAQAPAPPVTQP